jgi:predicted transcriptional regulator
MTTMAIREKLTNYLQVADDKKVKAMYALLKDDINFEGRISIEQYNKELGEAEAEYERGEFFTHEEMLKKIKEW